MPTMVPRLEPCQPDRGLINIYYVASGRKEIYLLLVLYPFNPLHIYANLFSKVALLQKALRILVEKLSY